jgi:hypothetical protein
MKKLIFLCLITTTEFLAQSGNGYAIELKKIYCDWVSATSFLDSVETIIYDFNDNIIPPSNNFYYEYHVTTYGNTPNTDIFGRLGLNKTFEDNDQNFIQTWYVVVKDATQQIILGTSNTASFQMQTEPGKAKQLIFQAKGNNGDPITETKLEHWMYVVNLWNENYNRFLTVNHDEVLRSSPNFILSRYEKFNHWNSNKSSILNHNHFYYNNSYTEILTANYKTVINASVRTTIDHSYINLDGIKFKDPWLRDYNEAPYGLRNQGLNAFLQILPMIDNNLSINSNHEGVFLNQSGPPLWTPPYYSVKADYLQTFNLPQTGRTHKFYFQGWSASPQGSAEFQNANALETPVVFKQENATVQAKYC